MPRGVHQRRAAILQYHRIAVIGRDPWRLSVEPSRFLEHLEVIRSRFHPIRLADLVQAIRDKKIPREAVALTFDDGYRDNLYEAKPLLERFQIPATVFVVTGYVDSGREFWWDVLSRLCLSNAQPGLEDRLDAGYRALHRKLQALNEKERRTLLEMLGAEVESSLITGGTTSTRAELTRLATGNLIELGAHTVTHPVLSQLTHLEQVDEMRTSKRQLEEIVGRSVDSFSYPYGSYDTETIECAREAGFACACTSVRTPVTTAADPLQLPRFHVENWSGDELESHLRDWLEV